MPRSYCDNFTIVKTLSIEQTFTMLQMAMLLSFSYVLFDTFFLNEDPITNTSGWTKVPQICSTKDLLTNMIY